MKRIFVAAVFLAFFSIQVGYCQANDDYRVGVGDVLEITVVEHQDLDRELTVAPDGTINFPLVGSINVKGMKVPEVNAAIESALKDGYIKYPQVSTSLKDAKNKVFYVYGEVNSPGSYQCAGDMTILKAISLAGGLTKFGSESNIKVLRGASGSSDYQTIRVNLKNITAKGDKSKDISIEPGDTIIVSE